MKTWMIRFISAITIAGILLGYNTVLEVRARDEQIARLNADLESAKLELQSGKTVGGTENDSLQEGGYVDGKYSGEAEGFGGMITLEVLIEGGRITAVNILSADGEDGAYLAMAKDIIPKIIEKQSADVDTVSGATFSSAGIKNAAAWALKEAAGENE